MAVADISSQSPAHSTRSKAQSALNKCFRRNGPTDDFQKDASGQKVKSEKKSQLYAVHANTTTSCEL